jgi:ketosteroid isomerase-like protein
MARQRFMTEPRGADVVIAMLTAIEKRQLDRIPAFYHPLISFHWPPGLPYGGTFSGQEIAGMTALFRTVWEPLQRTEELRRIDAEIVATGDAGQVVARYRWKGESERAGRFEAETLAEYVVRDGRVARAQMFHFDMPGLLAFLHRTGAYPAAVVSG